MDQISPWNEQEIHLPIISDNQRTRKYKNKLSLTQPHEKGCLQSVPKYPFSILHSKSKSITKESPLKRYKLLKQLKINVTLELQSNLFQTDRQIKCNTIELIYKNKQRRCKSLKQSLQKILMKDMIPKFNSNKIQKQMAKQINLDKAIMRTPKKSRLLFPRLKRALSKNKLLDKIHCLQGNHITTLS